ncbi:MAG TPA: KOW motif-containing protein [Pyrinomonadaceae bacterium]|jgi:transcriptional antiterminator NusG|nr:KOW motif-containing protein [Pyrinomonadaceae bacterium]
MSGFGIGDTVRIKNGAFANFTGIVDNIDMSNLCLIVVVEVFGRRTAVEVPLADAEKLQLDPRKPDLTNLN